MRTRTTFTGARLRSRAIRDQPLTGVGPAADRVDRREQDVGRDRGDQVPRRVVIVGEPPSPTETPRRVGGPDPEQGFGDVIQMCRYAPLLAERGARVVLEVQAPLKTLLAGLDAPTAGEVWLEGTELSALDEDGRAAMRGQHVGFVFQSFHLVPSLTALENVMLPLELAGRCCISPNVSKMVNKIILSIHHAGLPDSAPARDGTWQAARRP